MWLHLKRISLNGRSVALCESSKGSFKNDVYKKMGFLDPLATWLSKLCYMGYGVSHSSRLLSPHLNSLISSSNFLFDRTRDHCLPWWDSLSFSTILPHPGALPGVWSLGTRTPTLEIKTQYKFLNFLFLKSKN